MQPPIAPQATMALTTRQEQKISPFLEPGLQTKASSLAILQLSRDNLLPVYLQATAGEHDGYAEGVVVNTRYGSFPHSTMIGVPWGSQIRASKVDTGSRGRKRKRPTDDDPDAAATPQTANETEAPAESGTQAEDAGNATAGVKQAVAASSGFIHILPPTPEIWTMSLPHRTQVVYTPDYSYILHRIRARPGSVVIEAGAGSGSFSHAAVRAVYNGYPSSTTTTGKRKGKVFSYEYHEQRFHKMQKEIVEHGLEGLVHLTHRDVYNDGFLVDGGRSPGADAIFLDLPAPWEALPKLSRRKPESIPGDEEWVSPLNFKKSVYICTFSPCIEQVTRTVSALRRLGWVDIDMVEIANRKLHTVRDRVGLHLPVDRGVNNTPKDVDEAITRLAEIEDRFREHARLAKGAADEDVTDLAPPPGGQNSSKKAMNDVNGKEGYHSWVDGRLVTRGEPEIKTHTSYLVFAILPREWTEEDEAAALARYPVGSEQLHPVVGSLDKAARKKERRELLQKQGNRKARRKERAEKLLGEP
ncbi:tRNA methyltransferase complex GCD14 subunit-domain-containing protein [Apodospora peruviana]|uniref:tRNA (adenine(58)-N(1))-methyltransferase catalytic subunit TRM61 n=1 Tax=Apodospora peruviana TaxID=516989 RepID=A0AAE0II93_9PEZI|nr:tRNA methyltransferase complex GCD14 subunit-domain-containing protein [Apodospora peruviana]